jgi:cellulose synthase/poly-beta-1,6-N-acetylglucosamine synthase-like glycosyltransferase
MIQYVLWAVSFISLWITLVWLNVLVLEPQRSRVIPQSRLPRVTIALPSYNKAPFLAKTVRSLAEIQYPKQLLQVIIVDDASTDGTFTEAKRLRAKYPELPITVLKHERNQGKAAALNTALAQTRGELFACLDADTRVHPDSLRHLVRHFSDKRLGALISQVKVNEPKNLYERIQRVEYIMSNFVRRLMSIMGTLFLTPGVLSIYHTAILRKVGGFADGGLTEDLEIAMRLKARGYDVRMEPRSITYTSVPTTWRTLWRQRIRWYRGFLVNHLKYRHLFFSNAHGLFGTFQLPVNIIGVGILLLTVLLVSYGSLSDFAEMVYRSITIKGYFVNHVLDIPSLKELVLGQNIQITLPIMIGTLLGIYLIWIAHQQTQERLLRHLHYVWLYFFVASYVTTVHWITALLHEGLRTKRKW